MFSTGSTLGQDSEDYLKKLDSMKAFDDSAARVIGELNKAAEAQFLASLPDKRYRDRLPTIGHAFAHILLSHFAVHLGQLTVWRRACGYPKFKNNYT